MEYANILFTVGVALIISQILSWFMQSLARKRTQQTISSPKTAAAPLSPTTPTGVEEPRVESPLTPKSLNSTQSPASQEGLDNINKKNTTTPTFTKEEDDLLNDAFEATSKSYDLLDTAFDRVENKIERKTKAKDLIQRFRFREAIKELDVALEYTPGDITLLALQCEAYLGMLNTRPAIDIATKMCKVFPNNAEGPTWLSNALEVCEEMGSSLHVWRTAAVKGIEPFKSGYMRKCEDVSTRIRGAVSCGHTSPLIQHPDTKLLCNARYLADNASKEEIVKHLNKVWLVVGRSQLVSYLD
jgi:tetratricopeptide (TPR) repeat protein